MDENRFEVEEVKEAIKLVAGYCRGCNKCSDCDNEIRKWCNEIEDTIPAEWYKVII